VCWDDASDNVLLGPQVVQDQIEQIKLIRERLQAAQNRQKAYANAHRKDIEYAVGDKVFLKVSPMKGVRRFGVKGKLAPKYVGPYEITERIGVVAYRLALPPDLSKVHAVFHVSQLRRYRSDPSHVITPDQFSVEPDLIYSAKPIKILNRKEKKLRHKSIPLVKVLWRGQKFEEATWETEASMKLKHPELFTTGVYLTLFSRYKFRGRNFLKGGRM
jgi:hypothetical protein